MKSLRTLASCTGGEKRPGINCLRMCHHSQKNSGVATSLSFQSRHWNHLRMIAKFIAPSELCCVVTLFFLYVYTTFEYLLCILFHVDKLHKLHNSTKIQLHMCRYQAISFLQRDLHTRLQEHKLCCIAVNELRLISLLSQGCFCAIFVTKF